MNKSIKLLACSWLTLVFVLAFSPGAHAQSKPGRSIRSWVHCDGKTDDDAGVLAAFAAAKDNAFPLVVDCPVFIHVGSDVRRPVFIDNGMTVQFKGNGLFKVDNVQIPAFVIVNSTNVHLLGWRIQFTGQLPVQKTVAGLDNGAPVRYPGNAVSPAFTDNVLTQWEIAHRGIHFIQGRAPWPGFNGTSAIFLLVGSCRNVEFRDLKMFVAPNAKGSQFIPMAFQSSGGGKDNTNVPHQYPDNAQQFAVPSNITFSNVDLDGYYMGWQGPFQDTLFEHIRAHRYGDLQDDQGGNVGGIGKWFAPPHLFYLNYDLHSKGLENRHIRIIDVIDYGNRVGVARDRGGKDSGSGYADSLKIGGIDSEVDGYKSYRPDGLLDLLASTNLKISNVEATYDSSFLNNLYPAIRFPQGPYQNVTLQNFTLVDKAAVTKMAPITGSYQTSQLTMANIKVTLNNWVKGPNSPDLCPRMDWKGNKIDIQFIVAGHAQKCSQ